MVAAARRLCDIYWMQLQSPSDAESPVFLVAFDALMHASGAKGLAGCVALGVRRAGDVVYWVGRFGSALHSEITTALPERADASLVLDEVDADHMVTHGQLTSRPHLTLRGDRRLLARLFATLGPGRGALAQRAMRRPK